MSDYDENVRRVARAFSSRDEEPHASSRLEVGAVDDPLGAEADLTARHVMARRGSAAVRESWRPSRIARSLDDGVITHRPTAVGSADHEAGFVKAAATTVATQADPYRLPATGARVESPDARCRCRP